MTEPVIAPPPDALPAGPGLGIAPRPEDGPQPAQDPRFEEFEPTDPDPEQADPAVQQDKLPLRVGATASVWTPTAALNTARAHIGFVEGRNNDNPFWQWPPNYTWLRYASYCASAQSYVAWVGGGQRGLNAIHGGHYNCAEWESTAKRYGQWHTSGEQRGDLVLFDWSGNRSYAEHVGILESSTSTTVTCIEFNTGSGAAGSQSDGGGCYRRTRSKRFVVGYVRPSYGGEINVKPISNPGKPPSGKIVLGVDGVWGAATTRRLQQFMGLSVDGAIGPNTRKALQRLVKVAQDGVWGPGTRKALQRFVGVPQDGVWGPATVRAFQRYLNAQPLRRTVALAAPASFLEDKNWFTWLAGLVTSLLRRFGRNGGTR